MKYDLACTLEKILMAEVSGHISEHVNVFHDVTSTLYTITNIYLKADILLNAINILHSDNLALFFLTTIHSIQNSTKTETLKQQSQI